MSSSWQRCSCGLFFQQPLSGGCCPKCGQAEPPDSATPIPSRWYYAGNKQKNGPLALESRIVEGLVKEGSPSHRPVQGVINVATARKTQSPWQVAQATSAGGVPARKKGSRP
jgi:hypothetical protein